MWNNSTTTMLAHNWEQEAPGGYGHALFFGFASALLGISGFESSANYVEEQAPGVFPKTLRNMWIAVTVINPLIAFLAQCLMPIPDINKEAGKGGALLSVMADVSGSGDGFKVWLIVDAALVLSGAVLTSYVSFTGLLHRMTLDRCLPQALLAKSCRGTYHAVVPLLKRTSR